MSTIPSSPTSQNSSAAARQRAVIVVAACTIFGAVAQILIKVGMSPAHLDITGKGLVALALAVMTDWPLVAGYACYGLFTVAMVLALREGELSKLFPIIALTYVWVTLLSYWLLKDTPNWYKNAGIAVIVLGVAILGQGGGQK
ncbi:MAG TPA: EamA family transporter [Bryobacteraceae bacterium]|nr:EamA family transporter [Bryobacteraceae bacterium]